MKKRRVFRALAVLLTVALTLVVFEVLASIVLHYLPHVADGRALESIASEDLKSAALLRGRICETEPDPNLGYRQVPSEKPGALPVNRFGLRGGETAAKPDNGTTRVLLLGGSVVWGYTSRTLDDTLAAYLERDLGRRFEVLNGGLPGYVSEQSIAAYSLHHRKLRPAVVVLLCGTNEVYAAIRSGRAGARMRGTSMSPLWKTKCGRLYRRLFPPAFEDLSPPAPHAVAQALRSSLIVLADAGRRHGAQVMIVLQPMSILVGTKPLTDFERAALEIHERKLRGAKPYFRACYDAFGPMLAGVASERPDLLVMDATGVFEETHEHAYIDDCHLTPAGRRVLARAMANRLREGLR